MIAGIRKINRKVLIVICLLVFFFIAAGVQANQKDAPGKSKGETSTVLVNINTATVEQLSILPGVGAILAERIIKHRTEVGKFNTPSDLIAVKGVGQKKLDKMLNLIVVK